MQSKQSDLESKFRERVEEIVRQIPPGRVMTYGQIAALASSAYAARIVGGIAHFGDPELPWQRVVNKKGGLASGYPGGRAGHKAHLEAEGISVSEDYYVDVDEVLWRPGNVLGSFSIDARESLLAKRQPHSHAQPVPANGPLLVIVGETASGKSALGLQLAEQFDGEIICADSRTVYKGMDIGTAKPTAEEQQRTAHHCLDIVTPDEPFTVADFKKHALTAITDIAGRGKLPIMVGGTGLYIDAVLYDFQFRTPADSSLRQELQSLTIPELQERLDAQGIPLPNNPRNPRHLIRLLETNGAAAARKPLRENTYVLGLRTEKVVLEERIRSRVDAMIEAGFVDEVNALSRRYGWEASALQAPGYKAFRTYIEGSISLDEAKAEFIRNDLALAKRQRTWFKRNNSVHWFDNRGDLADIVEVVTTFLNK